MNLPKFLDSLPLNSHNNSDSALKEALVPTDPEQPPSDHQEIFIGQPIPADKSLSNTITASSSTTSLPYIHYGQYGPINPNQAYYPINNSLQTLNPALHDPTRPLSYHEFHLAGFPGCWRPFIGMLGLVVGLSIAAPLVWYVVFAFLYNLTGNTFEIDPELKTITPGVLAFMNLALASAIPITWLLARELHGLQPGWLSSVKSKIRWAWLRDCLGLSVIALLATIAVSWILTVLVENPDGNPSSESSQPGESTETIRDFVIVILLLTPLQAAGEEFAFRGYLTQAFGGLCSRRWVAVLVPATLFAMAHGSQTVPVFLDRFAFGLVTGLLVIMTGGLEAGIAMHVLNNLLAFGSALTMNDINSAMKAESGSWWRVPVTLTQSVVFFVLTMKMARKRGIETTVVKSEVNGQNNMPVQSFYPVPL